MREDDSDVGLLAASEVDPVVNDRVVVGTDCSVVDIVLKGAAELAAVCASVEEVVGTDAVEVSEVDSDKVEEDWCAEVDGVVEEVSPCCTGEAGVLLDVDVCVPAVAVV